MNRCRLPKSVAFLFLLLSVATNASAQHTAYSPDFRIETHNPDAEEQQRLQVVWHAAREENSRLIISGFLYLQSADRKSKKPIDWVQGVSILMARDPKDRPDWSKRFDPADSERVDCVIMENGSFAAEFDVAQINRSVGSTDEFQVGLCLAQKYARTIVWKNVPALPQSVATLPIAGPKPLSETLQIINAAPSIDVHDYDPVALIRAVNHLHSLGKPKAIAALRDFLDVAGDHIFPYRKRDPANIDTCDRWCVYLIVQLLFDPNDPEMKRPVMDHADMGMYPSKEDEALWPHIPIAVHADIPFLVAQKCGVQLGVSRDPIVFVEWAEKHGVLRKRKLRPPDDPLAAADSFLALPKTKRLMAGSGSYPTLSNGPVRRQAWRTIEPVVGSPTSRHAFSAKRGYDAEADWRKHKVIAKPRELLWDATGQCYARRVSRCPR